MDNQLAIVTAQLAQMIIIIMTFITIACLRKHPRLAEFWAGMVRQKQAAAILTLIYLITNSITLTALETDLPYILVFIATSGVYMFCLVMLGLGFTAKIAGFEPLHLRRGVKTIPGILVGALILFALSGLINIPIGQGLIALGITGPPEATSGLEFFQEFSLTEIFFMLLGGAGIAEEVIFRLFVMTGLRCLLKRPSLAILISAILFGLYHLSPLSALYLTFWEYPVYQFITTFFFGLAAAWIYQKKGLEAVILGHTLGDFVGAVMMKLSL
jgi:membrane protease YdiL (CAAX protease family)